ncbi:penicillin-binding protein 2 [Listeria sp. PSOL-1]|uniref:peptidoglycan D,D-transpeptidase FtsI family protein n=1 Tax=Listeria sp. PSOL-1 TaxID=1844999 RepID=UPI001E48FA32|nr:penicillin-binding protein 2 [Listeria sp. PSOL-1]
MKFRIRRTPNTDKKEKKKIPVLPLRLNILFFIVFLLFSALILRLGVVQIVDGNSYKKKAERTNNVMIKKNMPRGGIYDSHYNLLVGNSAVNTITYTRSSKTQNDEILRVAKKLNNLIDVPDEKISTRTLKNYWIATNEDESSKRLTKKEREKSSNEQYKAQLNEVTKADLDKLTKTDIKIATLYKRMTNGYALSEQIIKDKNVSQSEIARVSENLDELPGVDSTMNWNRYYPYDETLRSILGSVSTEKEGLPEDKVKYYLSQGYNRNDRVGKSYLESEYEKVLAGKKAEYETVLDSNNNIINTVQKEAGQNGKDLVLSLDVNLQKATEEILRTNINQGKSYGQSDLFDRAFVVAMDPRDGQVLAMAGQRLNEKGKFEDYSLGAFTTAYNMGSTVKGATELGAMMDGVITPSTVFVDQPIKIKGTKKKSSWFNNSGYNNISLNPEQALERSSNSYMFQTAMKWSGAKYVYDAPLHANLDTFSKMRKYYRMFGLGAKTEIDLPGEQVGYKGPDDVGGKLLDFAIGQYDSYTPLQLAQYSATIANGGKRLKPTLIKEIRDPSDKGDELGKIKSKSNATVLNKIPATEQQMKTVRDGFYLVTHGSSGTARSVFTSSDYDVAGKTGTAQAFYDGPKKGNKMAEVWNTTFIGYAPAKDPKIAISVVVPWGYRVNGQDHKINMQIAKQVLDKYFELQKKAAEDPNNKKENPTIANKDLAREQQAKANKKDE